MELSYDQAAHQAHRAAQLLEIVHLGVSPPVRVPDRFYWENLTFLDKVVDSAVTGNENTLEYLFFKCAAVKNGVSVEDIWTLGTRVEDYKSVIQLRGEGKDIPRTSELYPRKEELTKIFSSILAASADIARTKLPAYYR